MGEFLFDLLCWVGFLFILLFGVMEMYLPTRKEMLLGHSRKPATKIDRVVIFVSGVFCVLFAIALFLYNIGHF